MTQSTQVAANRRGFTIVELLVVIVVIAILAAILIATYTGITQRATASSLLSDLNSAYKKLQMSYVVDGVYPSDTTSLKTSSGNIFQYTVNNAASPPSFCLTATNPAVSNGYYVNNISSQPTAGLCPGHVQSPSSNSAPVITVQPSPSANGLYVDDYPLAYLTLTSAATGTPTPTVTWQKRMDSGSWVTISGATSSTLNEVISSPNGYSTSYYNGTWHSLWTYRAVWTNSSGTVYSNPSGTITILSVP
jgi:prepilin-type N-terminal cleavage/methylation domain-containing protein